MLGLMRFGIGPSRVGVLAVNHFSTPPALPHGRIGSPLKKILPHLFKKWPDASIATHESFMNVIQQPAMGSQLDTRSINVDKQKSECNFIVMKSEECPLLCVPLGCQFHIIMC